MKTPEEIADERLSLQPSGTTTLLLGNETVYNIPAEHASTLRKAMVVAVESDRHQHASSDAPLAESGFTNMVAAALHGRLMERGTPAALRAAERIASDENDPLWERILRPLIDQIEKAVA